MTDIYTRYEAGLRALLAHLGPDHPRHDEMLVYQQRLEENLAKSRLYGDTENLRAGRAEVISHLNALAWEALGISFNALCAEGGASQREVPPGRPVTYVNTGGGAYVGGNVTVEGGDFVGRDRVGPSQHTAPVTPLVYAPLLIWADLPASLPLRAPHNRARAIDRLRETLAQLPPLPLDLPALPPVCILSLDPTRRIERAFAAARRDLAVIRSQRDVSPRMGYSLLKLAGDLETRAGLWLGWDEVETTRNDPDKVHLLDEARRHGAGNTVVLLSQNPDETFVRLWPLLHSLVTAAEQVHVVGPADYDWPKPLVHAGVDARQVLELMPAIEDVMSPQPTPMTRVTDPELIERLDRLLEGQAGLRRGQTAIYQRLTAAEWRQATELREALAILQDTNTAALRDLRGMLDGLRRALGDIQDRQLDAVAADVRETLQEVTEVLGADVGIGTQLELLIPFLPFLVRVDLGGSVDLRQLVEKLMARIRKHGKG